MSISVTALQIPDVLLLEPEVYRDERGTLFEAWNATDFSAATGSQAPFVQDNQSRSSRGVLRGLHFQRPEPQGKLVRVLSGMTYTVAVDIRRGSPTFGDWVGLEISAENYRQLWIPPGFAHGLLALQDGTEVLYKLTSFYRPGRDHTIRWNDPAIGIEWPAGYDKPTVSPRDRDAPLLADVEVYD
jgi:dTDP-4-dehydrorhamnose 3,5-epimerase